MKEIEVGGQNQSWGSQLHPLAPAVFPKMSWHSSILISGYTRSSPVVEIVHKPKSSEQLVSNKMDIAQTKISNAVDDNRISDTILFIIQ